MQPIPQEADAFKSAMRAAWDGAAEGWDRHGPAIRDWLSSATEALLDAAQIGPGARVLDLAAGAGDQTIDAARRVGPSGSVLATDLSDAILDIAARHAREQGLTQIRTRQADLENPGLDGETFDAAVCRLGLMFCRDPSRALRSVHSVLAPGGRFAALVFSEPARNPCVGIAISTALSHAGLPLRDPFEPGALMSLGRPGLLESLMRDAGFVDVRATKLAAPFRLPSAADYVEFLRSSTPPLRAALARLDESDRKQAWADIERKLEAFRTDDGWEGPNELLLVSGARES